MRKEFGKRVLDAGEWLEREVKEEWMATRVQMYRCKLTERRMQEQGSPRQGLKGSSGRHAKVSEEQNGKDGKV